MGRVEELELELVKKIQLELELKDRIGILEEAAADSSKHSQYCRESFIGTNRDMDTAIQLYRVRKGNYTGSKHEMQSLVYNEELEDSVYSDDDDDNDPMPSTSPGSRTLVPTLCSRCSGASSYTTRRRRPEDSNGALRA